MEERARIQPGDQADDQRVAELVDRISAEPAPQAADHIESLPDELGQAVVEQMESGAAADVVSEMEPAEAADLLSELGTGQAADIVEAMSPDDAADVVGELAEPSRESILDEMEPAPTATVQRLLAYPPDTAGGIMTPEFMSFGADLTVEDTFVQIRRLHAGAETLYYLYVVDGAGRLTGVVSLRDLILASANTRLRDLAATQVVSVHTAAHREEVAQLINPYLALPVVDDDRRLVGIATVDDVVDVIQEEATEDIQRLVGASGDEKVDSPWLYSFRKRLPWLEVNLLTAFVAATVVGMFEDTIARLTALAVFLPIVAGQGGNTGAQALVVVVRALALGEVRPRAAARILLRELSLGLVSGVAVSVPAGLIAYLWKGSFAIGWVIACAMVVNMALATLAGAGIPLALRALRLDPAQSSSIVLTTVTDVVGFGAFLGLATPGAQPRRAVGATASWARSSSSTMGRVPASRCMRIRRQPINPASEVPGL